MSTPYPQRLRLQMVHRLVGPHAMSISALSRETGIAKSTLCRWLRQAGTMSSVTPKTTDKTDLSARSGPASWPPERRLQAIIDASGLDESQLGAFLRKEGLHQAQLTEWRAAATHALASSPNTKKSKANQKVIRSLRKELERKDKALAETAALLVLQGKARALWGGEGENTPRKNAKRLKR